MKHTEGKLELEYDNHGNGSYYEWYNVFIADVKTIAQVGRCRKLTEEDKANAQRIVDCVNGCDGLKNPLAVGELLETCKKTLDIINSYSHIPAQFEACQMLQQAINKTAKEV